MIAMLCDTCAILSLASVAKQKLTTETLEHMRNEPMLAVSPISLYEIGQKWARGKLPLPCPPDEWWARVVTQWNMTTIDITSTDMARAYQLPLHHRDPFDRILIAQALERNMSIATFDRIFESYNVPVLS